MNAVLGWASSSIIFAGAAQLTLISLLGSGAGAAAAVTAAVVINARHLMYSAALAPRFQDQPRWFRWVGPYALLDQVFALSSVRTEDDPRTFRTYYLAAGATFWILWQANVAIGLFLGPAIPSEWRIEFAVPVLFMGIVVTGLDRFPKLCAAVVGAGVTFIFAGLPNRAGLLVGALAGIAIGTLVEARSRRE